MTSLRVFSFIPVIAEAKKALSAGCSPAEAKALLTKCNSAYGQDARTYGEAAVKATGAYAELVAVQGQLEQAAARAVSRASGLQRM